MGGIKVLIFNKNKLYKDALVHLLKEKEKIKSVFSISQYGHVLPVLNKFNPDLVIIDGLNVGENNLKGLVENIKNENSEISIFILKSENLFLQRETDRFIDLTVSINKDHNYLYKMIKKYVNKNISDQISEESSSYRFHNLSKREMDVLFLISKGMTNKEISEQLIITERTVKNHVSSILNKLSVNDRTQALIKSLKMGIVELD